MRLNADRAIIIHFLGSAPTQPMSSLSSTFQYSDFAVVMNLIILYVGLVSAVTAGQIVTDNH